MALLFYAAVRSTELILLLGALMQRMFILLNTTTWLYAPELCPTRIRAFGTGTSVVVALTDASVMPYLAGLIFGASGVVGLFVMVAVMHLIMSVAAFWLNVETKGKCLEELSEV